MSPASEPNSLGSSVRTHFSWVRRQDLRFLGLRFLNIIICAINFIIFIIIKIIHIKNIIICIIINIINKISNKFEKNYYQY
jgi:hypothetical protein